MQRINHKRTQKKSEPQMGFEPTTLRVLDQMLNGDVFCKVIHGPVICFQLIVGSVPKFPIVKETLSWMWFR